MWAIGQFLDLMVQRFMTSLSKFEHIFSNFGRFGCFSSIGRSIDTQSYEISKFCERYVNSSSDHLNVMLLKYDGKDQTIIFGCWIYISKFWMMRYNQDKCYDTVMIDCAHSSKGS